MPRMPVRLLMLLPLLLVATAASCHAAVVVIANTEDTPRATDAQTIKDAFLGKTSPLQDVPQPEIVVQDNQAREEEFLDAFLGLSRSQFRNWWRRRMFLGEGRLPTHCADDAAVVAYIHDHPHAIGYIDDRTPHPGVRVIATAPTH